MRNQKNETQNWRSLLSRRKSPEYYSSPIIRAQMSMYIAILTGN